MIISSLKKQFNHFKQSSDVSGLHFCIVSGPFYNESKTLGMNLMHLNNISATGEHLPITCCKYFEKTELIVAKIN